MSMTPEEAYETLRAAYDLLVSTAEKVEGNYDPKQYRYSPFTYIPSKFKMELLEIRKQLIKYAIAKFQKKHMPNAEPTVDVTKALNEKFDELTYNENFIEQLFVEMIKDKKALRERSLEYLMKRARRFLPWGDYEKGERGPASKESQIRTGAMLTLRAYTASSYGGGISYNFNLDAEASSLEKIIDITLKGADPINVKEHGWLTRHIRDTRQEAQYFYGKQHVLHTAVSAFQFFKNGNFKIWFKGDMTAEIIARQLTGDKHKLVTL